MNSLILYFTTTKTNLLEVGLQAPLLREGDPYQEITVWQEVHANQLRRGDLVLTPDVFKWVVDQLGVAVRVIKYADPIRCVAQFTVLRLAHINIDPTDDPDDRVFQARVEKLCEVAIERGVMIQCATGTEVEQLLPLAEGVWNTHNE